MAAGINVKASIDGAAKFREDLKSMTARSKALDAEMKEMTNRFEKDGKAMGDDAKQRELSNKQIDAQKEKIALLTDRLKKLTDAGQGESKEAYELREKIAKANTELVNMQHSSDKASEGTKGLTASMLKANLGAAAITTALKGAVKVMKSIASVAGNAAKAVWNLGVESGQWADSLITQSTQFGIDVETMQEWGYAARFIDTEVDSMTKGLKSVRTAMTKKNLVTKKGLKIDKKHFVALKDANGQNRNEVDILYDVIDALHSMENVRARNAKAQEIFGKSYTDMIPLIESGSGALRQYAQEAREMGVIISAENVVSLGRFDDQMQRFDSTMQAIKTNLAVAFLPVLELVSGRLTTFLGKVSSALSDGFQKDDIKPIVDSFFDMFKVDNGDGTKQDDSVFGFIAEVVTLLGNEVSKHSADIKNIATTIFTYIGQGLKEALGITGLGEKIFGEEGTFFGFKVKEGSIADRFVKWAKGAAESFKQGFQLGEEENAQYDVGGKTFESLQERLDSAQAQASYQSWGVDAVTGFGDGMDSAVGEVESAADEEIGAVEKRTGPSAHSKSTHWGHELASGYADGIRAGIPEVSAASEAMAKAAAAPIHYSLPDYGPLRNVGKWGGEMIEHYISGIDKNAWKIGNAISAAIPNMAGNTTNYGGVNINVYGAAGQDVNQLADIVMLKMQSAVNRREAVFA